MDIRVRRFIAIAIDYSLLLTWGGLLFVVSILVSDPMRVDMSNYDPVRGQLIGFAAMTLPVFIYFLVMETRGGTLGKILMRIQVVSQSPSKVLVRNLVRFAPWEIAHAGVHWLFYYTGRSSETPTWLFFLLIVPQLVVLGYAVSVLVTKNSSIYDRVAGTSVQPV